MNPAMKAAILIGVAAFALFAALNFIFRKDLTK